MKFQNLEELAATLPNGLHDGELLSIAHSYATRITELVCKLDMSKPGQKAQAKLAKIIFSEVKFLAIDPPDPNRDYAGCSALTINSQESTSKYLPALSRYKEEFHNAAIYSIYANELNGFVHIGFGAVSLEWIGSQPSETGLYHYRARYYEPSTGRLISEDPIGFDGGMDFYSYVANNPMSFVDPTGFALEQPCLDVKKFVNWLDDNAKDKSQHHCAANVRKGLEAGGLNTTGRPRLAKDYGPFLLNLGFSSVSGAGYSPQSGDVVVVQPGPTPSGHVQAWDGNQWVSDFNQGSAKVSPYHYGKGETPSYAIYRFPHPCPSTSDGLIDSLKSKLQSLF